MVLSVHLVNHKKESSELIDIVFYLRCVCSGTGTCNDIL